MSDKRNMTSGFALTASRGILQDNQVGIALSRTVLPLTKKQSLLSDSVVIGWGRKENTERARGFAIKSGLPFIALEDGFLGYLSHPVLGSPRLSYVQDDQGIYYDAGRASALEALITKHASSRSDGRRHARAEEIRQRIKTIGASKYNFSGRKATLGDGKGPAAILLVDQTLGDMSVRLGAADAQSFQKAFEAALADYPDHEIWIKSHPDVLSGLKKGYLPGVAQAEKHSSKIRFIKDTGNVYDLLDQVAAVYCVTSQLGFEALIAGKKVVTFGWPFYAGWGLTEDRGEAVSMVAQNLLQRRTARPSIMEFLLAVLEDYAIYVDPFKDVVCDIHRALDLIEAELAIEKPDWQSKFRPKGFSLWKRSFLHAFLPRTKQKDAKYQDLLWGRKPNDIADGKSVTRMEDGFLRSVGLGSDLKRPASLVIDPKGIYFDATKASALEYYYNSSELSKAAEKRALDLQKALLQTKVSKYNLGDLEPVDFRKSAGDRQVILVPGQVESDASIRYGSPRIKTNIDLLKAVRNTNPSAYLVYKPHPDVMSGNREADVGDPKEFADRVVENIDIIRCFAAVDAVHTATSLSGFEALIRGLPVTTYGLPFYAGWGLTFDHERCERRSRDLTLAHLIYGALIAYPRYFSWARRKAVGPEEILEEISMVRHTVGHSNGQLSPLSRAYKKIVFLFEALLRY